VSVSEAAERQPADARAPMEVAVVIPVIDEERALSHVLRALAAAHRGPVYVVDGGSTDGTVAVAREHGAMVLVESRRGYGRACDSGARAAIAAGARILVFLDGDFADDPARLPRLLAPIAADRADLVIGARVGRLQQRGAMPAHQRAGNALVALLLRLLYDVPVGDTGSFRAIRAAVYQDLGLREMTYGWPVEIVARAALRGYRVREVPVPYRPRIGVSKVSGTVRGSARAGYRLLRTAVRVRLGQR